MKTCRKTLNGTLLSHGLVTSWLPHLHLTNFRGTLGGGELHTVRKFAPDVVQNSVPLVEKLDPALSIVVQATT